MTVNIREIENIAKGVANIKRIKILWMLQRKSPQLIEDIKSKIPMHYKTLNMHIQRLFRSGLIEKEFKGQFLLLHITDRGKSILTFLRKLE